MKFIPINVELRTTLDSDSPLEIIFSSVNIDHDLLLMQLAKLKERMTSNESESHVINASFNGISIRERELDSYNYLSCLIVELDVYSRIKDGYCPKKIAEFIGYYKLTNYSPEIVAQHLKNNAVIHSFNIKSDYGLMKDDLEYMSIDSYSGSYGVAYKKHLSTE